MVIHKILWACRRLTRGKIIFNCKNCGQELTNEIRFDLGWHCDYPCDTVTHDEDIQSERLNPEEHFNETFDDFLENIGKYYQRSEMNLISEMLCDSPISEYK